MPFLTQAINVASTAGQAASAISSLFGIGGSIINLGTFQFKDFEIPESVSYGSSNQLTVHKMAGGRRVIDNFGTDDNDITWSGVFLGGNDSEQRAKTLKGIFDAGDVIPLSFSKSFYHVIPMKIDFVMHKPWHIEYTLTLCIVDSKRPAAPASPSLLDRINADIKSATGIDISSTISTVSGYASQAASFLAPVTSALGPITALTGGSSAALGLLGTLQTAQSGLSGLSSLANSQLGSLASTTPTGSTAASWLTSATSLTNITSGLHDAAAFVGRSVNNLLP